MCMQGDLNLNICEAHAFNTLDKFSLDVFVVNGWKGEVRHKPSCTDIPFASASQETIYNCDLQSVSIKVVVSNMHLLESCQRQRKCILSGNDSS